MTASSGHAVDALGDRVWDVLEAAGFTAAPKGSGLDGFNVLTPRPEHPQTHVVVVPEFDGPMRGVGTPIVRHQILGRWIAALESAGFGARLYQVPTIHGLATVAIFVGADATAADVGLAWMVAEAEKAANAR